LYISYILKLFLVNSFSFIVKRRVVLLI